MRKLQPCNPGGTIDLGGGVSVSFVKAFHSSSTSVDGQTVYLGNPCGVVIEGLGKTVYHMGDTDIFGDMALIDEIFAPKIGFVPIGDRFTMGGEDGGARMQEVLPLRRRHADALWNVSHYRPGPRKIRGRNGWAECGDPGNRQGLRDLGRRARAACVKSESPSLRTKPGNPGSSHGRSSGSPGRQMPPRDDSHFLVAADFRLHLASSGFSARRSF